MAEQLQVLQIALVNEQCTAAQHTAPLAESIWGQHQHAWLLQQAGARCPVSRSPLHTSRQRDVAQRLVSTQLDPTKCSCSCLHHRG